MFSIQFIKDACSNKGITIAELERETGIGNGVIGKWPSAKGTPQLHHLVAIANYLQVPFSYIAFGEKDDDENTLNAIQLQLFHLLPFLTDSEISVVISTAQSLIASRTLRDSGQ